MPAPIEIHCSVGQRLELEVESISSAGYAWSFEGRTEDVRLVDRKLIPGRAIGAATTERFILEPLRPGHLSVRLRYGRPWEADAEEVRSYVLVAA